MFYFGNKTLYATTNTSEAKYNLSVIAEQLFNVNNTYETYFLDDIFSLNFEVKTNNKKSN